MEQATDSEQEPRAGRRVNTSDVSDAMVRLYKELFGRGPTKAHAAFAGPDTLICTLEHSLTPAELNMAAAGDDQRLRELRLYFQHSSEKRFIETVEALTGRSVRAFTSGMDTQSDLATEAFYFAPEGVTAQRRPDELTPDGA